jgi:hypothetical protein
LLGVSISKLPLPFLNSNSLSELLLLPSELDELGKHGRVRVVQ